MRTYSKKLKRKFEVILLSATVIHPPLVGRTNLRVDLDATRLEAGRGGWERICLFLYFMVLYIISASARVVSELFFIFAQGKIGNDFDSRRTENLSAAGVASSGWGCVGV